MKPPLVYIIILNWNGCRDTIECLESVFKLDYDNFKVIVVDNGSIDDSVLVIRKRYPQVILIENRENLGYTGGNNIAMHYAMEQGAEYMWLLNNDTLIERNTLEKLVGTAGKSDEIGMVSPVIYYLGEPEEIQFCGCCIDWKNLNLIKFENTEDALSGESKMPDQIWLWGTALLIRSKVILKVGYLDEQYFAYWEDVDYSIRANIAGFRNVVDHSARIYHKLPRARIGEINHPPHYFYYMARNEYLFWTKYLKGLKKVLFLKRYLGDVILLCGGCFNHESNECVDACFKGVASGVRKIGGPWERSIEQTYVLRKLRGIFSWHPNLWGNLLKGNYAHIVSEVVKRGKTKLFNN